MNQFEEFTLSYNLNLILVCFGLLLSLLTQYHKICTKKIVRAIKLVFISVFVTCIEGSLGRAVA